MEGGGGGGGIRNGDREARAVLGSDAARGWRRLAPATAKRGTSLQPWSPQGELGPSTHTLCRPPARHGSGLGLAAVGGGLRENSGLGGRVFRGTHQRELGERPPRPGLGGFDPLFERDDLCGGSLGPGSVGGGTRLERVGGTGERQLLHAVEMLIFERRGSARL